MDRTDADIRAPRRTPPGAPERISPAWQRMEGRVCGVQAALRFIAECMQPLGPPDRPAPVHLIMEHLHEQWGAGGCAR